MREVSALTQQIAGEHKAKADYYHSRLSGFWALENKAVSKHQVELALLSLQRAGIEADKADDQYFVDALRSEVDDILADMKQSMRRFTAYANSPRLSNYEDVDASAMMNAIESVQKEYGVPVGRLDATFSVDIFDSILRAIDEAVTAKNIEVIDAALTGEHCINQPPFETFIVCSLF